LTYNINIQYTTIITITTMTDSSNPASASFMSEEDLKDMGITRSLWDTWYSAMSALYAVGLQQYPSETAQIENNINIGDISISANFVNGGWIEVSVAKGDVDHLSMRHEGNMELLIGVVFAMVQSLRESNDDNDVTESPMTDTEPQA
jgi:hypothetical protein